MKLTDFYYDLPEELIAQDPLEKRSDSRLMVVGREDGSIAHRHFYDILDYVNQGDCLVVNDTKVIPARLMGVKEDTGASIEVLLLKRKEEKIWETLVKPGKKARVGAKISFGDGLLVGEVVDIVEEGNRLIQFEYEGIWEELLDRLGQMPLPPYITHQLKDRNRYQTVYAKNEGSAAAPTAGLHFTNELIAQLKEKGGEDNILEHHMHSEFYVVEEEEAAKINAAKQRGNQIISVGTTSTRTLESVADDNGIVRTGSGWTDIFIYPGYQFKVVDSLITNFHLPESTLLMLVSAFSTREKMLHAYEVAVEEGYRFFSFGDAMLIRKKQETQGR